MLNLSFSGCGFLGIYHIGVVSAFREHAPDIIQNNKISGCSAGSLVAACALCDCCLGQMVSDVLEIALKARSYSLGPLHPSFSIVEILRNGLRRILPVDAHKICSGRLNVSLTRWKDGKNWLVNSFDTREELIQALICSSFVPFYSGFMPPKFKGVYCWDGGLSNNNPILDQHTIVVSPFGGESDICPREESASYYCFDLQGTNIQWSKENFYRLSKAFFPPSPQVLKAICFRGYKDAVHFLRSRNLLNCSCERVIREKSTIQSLMGDDFPLYDSEGEDNESIIDSEDEQVEQYAQSAEPLKFQEMPTPVCDILDAACADHKESLINYVYNSQISRAISILFLPWTLPVEMTLLFTKKLVECLPKINVPNDSNNLVDTVLIYLNFLIQKFTYDKYQYHARVSCKLCVLKSHQIDSKVGGLKFSLCYHSGNNQQSFVNTGISSGPQIQEIDKHSCLSDCNSTVNSEQALTLFKPPTSITQQQQQQHDHHHQHHHHNKPLKLCARHRLPSKTCLTSSENTNSIITSTTTTAPNTNIPLIKAQQRRRKYVTTNNLQKLNIDSNTQQVVSSLGSSYSATVHDMQSSSLSSSYKTSKYFDRERTEKKLRRYKLKSITNANINNSNNSKSCNDLNKRSNSTVSLTEPINIPKFNLKVPPASFDDSESVLTIKESNSENDDDNLNISTNDDENDDVYDNKEFNLNKNYKLLKKKLRKLNNNKNTDADLQMSSYESIKNTDFVNIKSSSITTINEINELNLDFSFNVEETSKDKSLNDANNSIKTGDNSKNSQLDFDTYLDKLELNLFGNINN